jgi:hypothetical protein
LGRCISRMVRGYRSGGKWVLAMRVHTPTSIEQVKRYIDRSDIFSLLFAAPIALALRDPNLFGFEHNVEAITYSAVAFVVGGS